MSSDLESRIRETGMHLYDLMEGESKSIFRKEYWTGKLFEWCMHNEPFKVQMFRFIDVFPYLKHPDSVIRHIQEYFSDPALHFPSALEKGIKFMSPSWMSSWVIAGSIARNIRKIARQFIIGATPEDSLPALQALRGRGMAFTLDLLGEAVVSEREAEDYLDRYLALFDSFNDAQKGWAVLGTSSGTLDWGHSPRLNISLKTSAMYSQMDPCAFEYSIQKAKERLRPILRKAIATTAFVYLDMEHYAVKNLTLALYRSLMEESEFRGYPHTGIVLQAYLRDCEADLNRMIAWAEQDGHHFTIRLVKGAYWDQETIHARQNNWPVPVFSAKYQTDANFEHLARTILLNHRQIKLACASHNIRSIAAVVETAKDLAVTDEDLEFQVLYGMGEPVRTALRKAGLHVRVYSPIGEMVQGMSYLVRRLLENTANESFLRQSFSQKLPVGHLLRNPADKVTELPRPGFSAIEPVSNSSPFRNEPHLDWSQEEHRTNFASTLTKVRAGFPIPVSLEIDGEIISTRSVFRSLNPNRPEEAVGIVSLAGIAEAEHAILAAKSAFPAWRYTSPEIRARYLFKAAEAARRRRYELAALQVFEVGKSWSEADGDVCEAIDFLEYYGREMIRYGRRTRMGHVPGETSELIYEPRGVSVVIAPWNFPLAISMGMSSAAVVTGNTVVYKPASQSPVTGSMLARIFEEAGLPKGVFNFLPGPGGELGDYLTGHPEVALIAFTGSRNVGLHIIERAYKTLPGATTVKNVIAEMGGKNAIIVDSDADLDEAIIYILQSAFGYQGQKCSACSRLIVLEENYDRLVDRLKAAAESLNIGPTEYAQNFMGAVVEPAAREKVLRYIELGKKEGSVLLERHVGSEDGHFVPLTIFTGITPGSRLAQDEIFGPLLAVIKVKDFDEALQVANGTEYALTGGVLSRSPGNISKARKNFRTGNLYVNRACTGAVVGRHPFGGFKMSGLGSKAGGPDYLLHFMVPANIVENTVRRGFAPTDSLNGEAST
jgi:RHH-type transcriptional regulator, proline utilization regulon repressor / proline dehydrogenase / delta 1-pyrroline-5-carboxylate dehydrogenase